MKGDKDADWRKDAALAQAADAAPGSWMLVDLRTLRTKDLASEPPEWRELSLGYDIAILAPTITATSLLGVEKTRCADLILWAGLAAINEVAPTTLGSFHGKSDEIG